MIKNRNGKALFIIAGVLLLSASHALAEGKISFWDTQRKGANMFNVIPDEQWFRAARDLGIEWVRLAYDKWRGRQRDFLMGDAGNFTGLVREDCAKLIKVLDWADKYNVKAVITPLGLPGSRWAQNNGDRQDLRLWRDKKYWRQAADFWRELAAQLKNHPAVSGYNILNEPTPEMDTGLYEESPSGDYLAWYRKYKGTSHDLPAFYDAVITAIRSVDPDTPVMVDAGWYARPTAFAYWPKLRDEKVLYAFHVYEPYRFTNRKNFTAARQYAYPGKILFEGKEVEWDTRQIERFLAPCFAWARQREIPPNRLVAGEFGCYRRNPGCQAYLTDVIGVLNARRVHWAVYTFRADEWDGYDYEVGTGGLGEDYWKTKEAGQNPEMPRKDNPLFGVIKKEFRKK